MSVLAMEEGRKGMRVPSSYFSKWYDRSPRRKGRTLGEKSPRWQEERLLWLAVERNHGRDKDCYSNTLDLYIPRQDGNCQANHKACDLAVWEGYGGQLWNRQLAGRSHLPEMKPHPSTVAAGTGVRDSLRCSQL